MSTNNNSQREQVSTHLLATEEVLAGGRLGGDGEGELGLGYTSQDRSAPFEMEAQIKIYVLSEGNTSWPFSYTGGSCQILNQVAPSAALALLAAGTALLRYAE